VSKANGSRECAPDDKLRVPIMTRHLHTLVGSLRLSHLQGFDLC
jgi:hypothetical protein